MKHVFAPPVGFVHRTGVRVCLCVRPQQLLCFLMNERSEHEIES